MDTYMPSPFNTVSADIPPSPSKIVLVSPAHILPYNAKSAPLTWFKVINVACGIVQLATNEFDVFFQIYTLG
jgi:hypothetical protein